MLKCYTSTHQYVGSKWPRIQSAQKLPNNNNSSLPASPLSTSHRGLVLVQDLVVLGHGHAEDDGRHILETVDPLLSLRPLAAHVEKPAAIPSS